MRQIIIGSRGSDLALWQATHVKEKLSELGVDATITIIKTQGDLIQNLSFDKMEGKGFFTKELENALLEKSIDIAVHSHKDIETNTHDQLMIGAVSERENPRDILLINNHAVNCSQKWDIELNVSIGTSSARRKSQIVAHRPDLRIEDLRGNVPTRIEKLRSGNYDAIVIAVAGLNRLKIDVSEFHAVPLSPEEFIPAPAQGALGIQIRKNDQQLIELLKHINHLSTQKVIEIERNVLRLMQGGCQLPLGVYCKDEHNLYVSYASKWENGADYRHYQSENLNELVPEIVNELQRHNQ